MHMTVYYKNQKFKNVRAIAFDISNELGVCAYLVQEIETPEDNPALNNKVVVLEGIAIGELKVEDNETQD